MLYFGGNLEMFNFNYYQVLHAYRVCSLWDWCNSDGGDAGGGRHQLVQTSGLPSLRIIVILLRAFWQRNAFHVHFCFCPQKIRKAQHHKYATRMIRNFVTKVEEKMVHHHSDMTSVSSIQRNIEQQITTLNFQCLPDEKEELRDRERELDRQQR